MDDEGSLTPETGKIKRPVEVLPQTPPLDSSSTVFALIGRVTIDPGADVEKLDRIMVIYESLKAREAALAHNAAKGRILKKLASIRSSRIDPLSTKSGRETPKKAPMKLSNTSPWRRSTNTCAL